MSTDGHRTTDDSPLPSTFESANALTTANLLTLLRIALTVPFLYFISHGRFALGLVIFFLAGLTDFADGYVARRFDQQTRLGRFLDPLADKVLITGAFVVMALPRAALPSVPIWLAAAVVGRDFIIVLGSLVVYMLTRFKDFRPTLLGKINTFTELGLIFWFLVFHTAGRLIFLLPFLYAIVIASVIVSGTDYAIQGIRILKRHKNCRRASNTAQETGL